MTASRTKPKTFVIRQQELFQKQIQSVLNASVQFLWHNVMFVRFTKMFQLCFTANMTSCMNWTWKRSFLNRKHQSSSQLWWVTTTYFQFLISFDPHLVRLLAIAAWNAIIWMRFFYKLAETPNNYFTTSISKWNELQFSIAVIHYMHDDMINISVHCPLHKVCYSLGLFLFHIVLMQMYFYAAKHIHNVSKCKQIQSNKLL